MTDNKKSESDKSSEETKDENYVEVWIPRLLKEDEHPWLPSFDYFIGLFMRFDTSFLFILVL
jgi:hypothetical protein